MNPLENAVFGADPWWIVLIKVVLLFVILLVWTIFNVWYERRLVAKMQHRLGPIMNPTWAGGLGQAMADGAKLLLKEDFRPDNTDKVVFNLAPILTGVAAFTSWSVIPFGGEVTMFGHRTHLQLTDLPVAVLFILASASIGIYGIVLAGWASNSTYSAARRPALQRPDDLLRGRDGPVARRGVPVRRIDVDLADRRRAGEPADDRQLQHPPPGWYALLLFPSFIIYAIAMVGETNRAPFDLPECESELVSGYITEYSGFRYAMYFLAEYINMATVSAVATTLFLGGFRAPWPFNLCTSSTTAGSASSGSHQGAAADQRLRVAAGNPAALPLRPVHGPRMEVADPDLAGLAAAGRDPEVAHRPSTGSAARSSSASWACIIVVLVASLFLPGRQEELSSCPTRRRRSTPSPGDTRFRRCRASTCPRWPAWCAPPSTSHLRRPPIHRSMRRELIPDGHL